MENKTLEKLKTHGKKRSREWPKVRKAHLDKHPACKVCRGLDGLNVHHIKPFHVHPELELDPRNLVTLCEGKKTLNCHLIFGHWGNFANKWNPSIILDAAIWRVRFAMKHMHEV